MSKLLSVALAAFLATGAIAQTYGPAPSAGKKSEPAATTGTGTGASTGTSTDTGTATGATGTTPGTAGSTSGSTRASGAASAPGLTCPPGLEMRDNDCLPPGQEKKGTGGTAPMR